MRFGTNKSPVEYEKLLVSILNLREEMREKDDVMLPAREVFFKLNSFLFSEYPHEEHDGV